MKCSQCRKKRERLFCSLCSAPKLSSQILKLTTVLEDLREKLEEKVAKTLHFYIDGQELKEKILEIRFYQSKLAVMRASLKEQDEKRTALLKIMQWKLETAKKLSALKNSREQQVLKIKETVNLLSAQNSRLELKVSKMRVKKLGNFTTFYEINTIYPNWSIIKEIRLEQEGDFSPIEEEDISDACIESDSNEEKFEKFTFAKNFSSLNSIYGGIMSFSLSQLAKLVYYFSLIYRIPLPLVISLKGDKVNIWNFLQNKEGFAMKNISNRKNFTEAEKFLVLLFMDMKFIIRSFGLQGGFINKEFINWKVFIEFFIKWQQELCSKKGGGKEILNKNFYRHSFKMIKVKYREEKLEKRKFVAPVFKMEDSVVVVLQGVKKTTPSFGKENSDDDKSANISNISLPSEEEVAKSEESFEILDNVTDCI